jgi:hypothetical protein
MTVCQLIPFAVGDAPILLKQYELNPHKLYAADSAFTSGEPHPFATTLFQRVDNTRNDDTPRIFTMLGVVTQV